MIIRLFLLFAAFCLAPYTLAKSHFTVLLYHHVSSDTPASTSVTPEQFKQHLDFLRQKNFTVMDLQVALSRVRQNQSLPDRAVAITFDDAYRSIYQHAFPELKRRQLPFTVFVSTDPVDREFNDMMTWDMMRQMQFNGVRFANHTTDHSYLVRGDVSGSDWLEQTLEKIDQAQTRLIDELGPNTPKWFAYPYGEYNSVLREALAERGWIAFGQQSGAIGTYSDFQALPRFPAAGIYANLNTLEVKLNSTPLPVDYEQFPDPVVNTNPPVFTARVTQALPGTFQLNCFADGEPITPKWVSDTNFQIIANQPLSVGRHRYNCTYPQANGKDYYWMSWQWLVQD